MAGAQAKEARIELSLERVRARAMAMQNSHELADLVSTVFKELTQLDFVLTSCIIWIHDPEFTTNELWVASSEINKPAQPYYLKAFHHPFFKSIIHAWKAKDPKWVFTLTGDEKQSFEEAFFNDVPNLPNALKTALTVPEKVVFSASFNNFGALEILGTESLSDEKFDILHRFGKVFDSSYTRFNDLKKAEAQARESQIQLAMERVRARTMAMQRSDELQDAASVMVQQIQTLGVPQFGSGFNIWDNDRKAATAWMCNVTTDNLPPPFKTSSSEDIFLDIHDAAQRGESFFVREQAGKELETHYMYMNSIPVFREYAEREYAEGFSIPGFQIMHCAFFSQGYLMFITYNPVPEAHDIFKRFAKDFEQTYTRFLDLQKAEAQARESQIQLAMERVRARTMAMQRSDELSEAASLLFQQVQSLGAPSWTAGYCIWDEDKKAITLWMSSPSGGIQPPFRAPLDENPTFIRYLEADNKGMELYIEEESGKVPEENYQYLLTLPVVGELLNAIMKEGYPLPTYQVDHCAYFSKGFLLFITYQQVPELHDIFKRFAAVFDQTYTRFLDLQKAEAQAREAKIEAALERVRSRTMAMQRSEELMDAASLLFQQVSALGVTLWGCGFNIWEKNEKICTSYNANPHGTILSFWEIPLTEDLCFIHFYESRQRGDILYVDEMGGEQLEATYHYMRKLPGIGEGIESILKAGNTLPIFQVNHLANFSFGNLLFITYQHVPEAHDIFVRFAKVFEQTYTRFLDLQKAEAQAKEAQIEAALERVRSRSMGMQKSEELKEVIQVVYDQFVHLNIKVEHTGFVIDYKARDDYNIWIADPLGVPSQVTIPYFDSVYYNRFNEAKEKGEDFFATNLSFEEKNRFYQKLFEYVPNLPEESKKFYFSCPGLAASTVLLDNVCLYIENFSGTPYSDENNNTLMRFGKVFQQTYTRFLDLQKAEAQAREAQIEAALEKVRGRSMGMQKSDELRDVIQVIFEQLIHLNFNIDGAGFGVDFRESDDWNIWNADAYTPFPTKIHIPYFDHPVANAIIEAKNSGVELVPLKLTIEERNTLLDHVFKYAPASPEAKEVVYNTPGFAESDVLLKNVLLFIHNYAGIPYTDAENATLIRFGKVFEQTYTRFKDLEKAEAQARETVKQASVDRVRAEIASMRTTSDLEKITPLIWNELTTLGVPFIRCGVFIMDEEQQLVHTFLSTPEGKAIATLHVPFQFNLSIITNGVGHWRKKEIYKEHWDAATFTKSWIALSSLMETSDGSHQHEQPPKNLYLHMLPFLQGMLYAGNTASLSDDELQLVQNLAGAFSTAYARYEDFNKLELAKEQIEKTLVDLKQAQAQLVQSEKMASLGELTAGIAHEIQNPLNFVNNFSEVNKELLVEMKDEMEKGNYADAKDIANDVIGNEEKINHHGKRADAIVKGMLQHSRTSSATKEPTDINKLADEYLRLAYHGLRAKDKSFNATLKTDYDESIGNINIIPQDIGRVVLNLINNAFYVVSEKAKQQGADFEPTVSVSTKKIGDKVEISVKDNGNGISQKVLDKIFQPFFTTKPTGQGTGLGLSLAYDIIKAHGGELNVQTKEGKGLPAGQAGTEFIIQLPIT